MSTKYSVGIFIAPQSCLCLLGKFVEIAGVRQKAMTIKCEQKGKWVYAFSDKTLLVMQWTNIELLFFERTSLMQCCYLEKSLPSFQTKKGRGVGGNFMVKCVKLKTRRTQFDLNQTEKICDSIKIQFYLKLNYQLNKFVQLIRAVCKDSRVQFYVIQ